MNNALFLDFDGVLHPIGSAQFTQEGPIKGVGLFQWLPQLLEVISPYLKLKLVIHSSWRFVENSDEKLFQHLPTELVKRVCGTTDRNVCSRYASIVQYCLVNKIDRHIILDDEPNMFDVHDNLIICNSKCGLSDLETVYALKTRLRKMYDLVQR